MITLSRAAAVAALIALGLAAGSPRAAIWTEFGDAGRLPASAQTTIGAGELNEISGELIELAGIDMFAIRIVDPAAFSAATLAAFGSHVTDPQLFLFDDRGFGVYMNDDDDEGRAGTQSVLPAAHPFGPRSGGLYYLAIGRFDNEPQSALGRVFAHGAGTMGPDPDGGGAPVQDWNDDVLGRIDFETGYRIMVTGARFAVPEPSGIALLAAGIAVMAGFRLPARRARRPVDR